MSRMNEYQFYTTDILTGEIRDQVELSTFHWQDIYRRPGSATATARLEAPTTTIQNFDPWRTGLWAVKGGQIRWGGLIGACQPRAGSRVIQIPTQGFLEYFRTRQLRSAQGMTYGTLENYTDITWEDVDQFRIVKDLIDHAQSFPNGNINFGVNWASLSGQEVNLTYRTFNIKYVGVAIEQLADRLNGFDFRTRFFWDGDEPRAELYLATKQGRRTNWLFAFETERPVITEAVTQYAANLPGVSGSYIDAIDDGMLSIVGDLELQILVAPDDWISGSEYILMSKWLATGNEKCWKVAITAAGNIKFYWTEDGSTELSATSSAIVPFIDGALGGIKIEFDVDNGAAGRNVLFYTSDDQGANWSQLGTTQTSAGVTSIYDSDESVNIGSSDEGTAGLWAGKALWAQIRKGIDGVYSSWFDARGLNNSEMLSVTDVRGNIWTFEGDAAPIGFVTADVTTTQSVSRRTNIKQYDLDGGDKPVTGVAVIGEGEGDDMVRVFVDDPNTSLPLYEDTRTYKEVSNPTTLLEHGSSYIASRKVVRPQITLKLDQNLEPYYTEYDVGDEVKVRIRDGYVQQDGLFVVGSKKVTLSKQQDEHVEIEVISL